MNLYTLRQILGWSAVINIGLLLWWFGIIVFARTWVYKVHSKWFKIPEEQFYAIHYTGMMYYKLTVLALFIAPYIALRIIG
ncbi:MAG: hypothetical protein V1747_01295 [Candidatus Omnitrophota bacterium]